MDSGKLGVKWDEWDVEYPRFSEYGVREHMGIGTHGVRWKFQSSIRRWDMAAESSREERMEQMRKARREMTEKYAPYAKVIGPEKT